MIDQFAAFLVPVVSEMKHVSFPVQFPQFAQERKQLKTKENRVRLVWHRPCHIRRRALCAPTPGTPGSNFKKKGGEQNGDSPKVDQGSIGLQ
jgi:hypothetical protein